MTQTLDTYDIIIGGGGASGLSLAYRLADEAFHDLKVLLLEPDADKKNDRTWCSWVKPGSVFDELAFAFFDELEVRDGNQSIVSKILPYRYRMIRSAEFYEAVHRKLQKWPNISVLRSKISREEESDGQVLIETDTSQIFKAPLYIKTFTNAAIRNHAGWYVDQHFAGWFVKFEEQVFQEGRAIFMDFSIEQNGEVRFMYVLPYSDREALIELAVFSNDMWKSAEYDEVIKKYIHVQYPEKVFEILEREEGSIPMTSFDFTSLNTKSILHLGGAGGAIKPSTGFAFTRIQEQCDYLVDCLRMGKAVQMGDVFSKRHQLYDKTLLNVILKNKLQGSRVFMDLFSKNKMVDILKFLDEDTSLLEELKIMASCDMRAFGRAFLEEI